MISPPAIPDGSLFAMQQFSSATLRSLAEGPRECCCVPWRPDHERDFYVSVVDVTRYRMLVGPFERYDDALSAVDSTRQRAVDADPKAWFYSFGTCSVPKGTPTNPLFGAPAQGADR